MSGASGMSPAEAELWKFAIGLIIGAVIVLGKVALRIHWQHKMAALALAGDAEAAAKLKASPPPQIIGSGPTLLLALGGWWALAPHVIKPEEARAAQPAALRQVAQKDPGREMQLELPARDEDVILWRRRP